MFDERDRCSRAVDPPPPSPCISGLSTSHSLNPVQDGRPRREDTGKLKRKQDSEVLGPTAPFEPWNETPHGPSPHQPPGKVGRRARAEGLVQEGLGEGWREYPQIPGALPAVEQTPHLCLLPGG